MISAFEGPSPGTDFLRDLCKAQFTHTDTSLATCTKVSSTLMDTPKKITKISNLESISLLIDWRQQSGNVFLEIEGFYSIV
jgi:hypothetical protein